jgi:hypothetical protein
VSRGCPNGSGVTACWSPAGRLSRMASVDQTDACKVIIRHFGRGDRTAHSWSPPHSLHGTFVDRTLAFTAAPESRKQYRRAGSCAGGQFQGTVFFPLVMEALFMSQAMPRDPHQEQAIARPDRSLAGKRALRPRLLCTPAPPYRPYTPGGETSLSATAGTKRPLRPSPWYPSRSMSDLL